MSRLLVAYASKHRATAEIARAIVRRSLVVHGRRVRGRSETLARRRLRLTSV